MVSDFSGRIRAIIDENTTVMVPAVRVAITLGKLAAYSTKANASEAISWIIGSEIEDAETSFMPCWRMRLLTELKRSVSTCWPPKISTSLWPFSICSALVVTCPMVFCMFLLILRKRLETMRIAIETIGASTIRITDSCQL
ncbi:hypothetical protein D3C73_1151810 [compost metagenome]